MATSGRTAAGDKEKADALTQMNLTKILRAYLRQMVEEVPGYKAFLLDKETMRVCSTLYGRSELADHSLVHIERIDGNDGAEHLNLKALCFVRPTRENITHLKRELRQPRYQSYHIYFTNIVSQMLLQDLAEADAVKEAIQNVQEFYGDYIVIEPHHFTIPCARPELLLSPKASLLGGGGTSDYELLDRFVQGLSALCLSIRRKPIIRYQRGSEQAQRLADSLYNLTYKQQYQIFDFGARSSPVLLILDRRDDPVTPLLTQWTYQAMVHELLGIADNTVKLTSTKIPAEQRDVVFDTRQDDFLARHVYANYGEVGAAVKSLVEKFSAAQAQHKKVDSLADMQRFVMEHSDFQKAQSSVAKHVNVVAELSAIVSERGLLDVSGAEQELANPAATLSAATAYDETMRIIRNLSVRDGDKIRLVMLYALRFETDTLRVRSLSDYLVTAGVRDREPQLYAAIDAVLQYAGGDKRAGDLYGSRNLLGKAKNLVKGLQGVDNVYTQHTPLLSDTVQQLAQSSLPPAAYPFLAANNDEALAWQAMFKKAPPREAVVFVIGGTTYEEAKAVAEWNEKHPEMKVVLGGSGVLNSEAFLQGLSAGYDLAAGAQGPRLSIH